MMASPRTAIGLDINDTSLCVVELKATAGGLRLLRSACAPTPAGSVRDGTIVQPKIVGKAVKKLLRSARLATKGKRAVVSLSGSAVVARVTQLPAGGPGVIKRHLQQEIKRYAVFTGDATVSDFTLIHPPPGRQEGRPALLAVAREDAANALARTVLNVRLDPAAIDVSFLAVARALFSQYLSAPPPAAVLLAVVECNSVHLIVAQGGTVRFVRTTALPGDVLHEATAGASTLASEIRSVLDFYGTQIGNLAEVQRVVVWTSQDVPPNVAAGLSRALGGLPVALSSPASISEDAHLLSDNGRSPTTACAVGLAMRRLGETAFPVNLDLLPARTVRLLALKKRALVTAILAGALFLLALLGMGAVHLRLNALNREVGRVRKALTSAVFPPSAHRVKTESARISDELQAREACLRSAQAGIFWSRVLSEIKERIPPDVRLTSLRTRGSDELTIDGESLSLASVYRFAQQLADSDLIRSAKPASVETVIRDESATSIYRIDCQLGALAEHER